MALLAAGAAGSLVHAFGIEPRWLAVTRKVVECPMLSPGWDGMRVGVLADIHFKPEKDERLLCEAVEVLIREKPDVIVMPGDFIDHSPGVLGPMLRILSGLEAPLGVFASPGNHDGWSMDCAVMRRKFEKCGISFLINGNTRVSGKGGNLVIAATDHVWLGKPDPGRAMRGVGRDEPVIALVHEPDYFDVMVEQRPVALQVSGHTHGGQCKVPVLGYAPARVAYGRKYLEGAYGVGKARLFVTRGIGTTGMRVRFACPPEVALLTLRARENADG